MFCQTQHCLVAMGIWLLSIIGAESAIPNVLINLCGDMAVSQPVSLFIANLPTEACILVHAGISVVTRLPTQHGTLYRLNMVPSLTKQKS
jgi:hypothetical protein